uniref:kinetochore-associated protein 1-like n=1 Tax=Myxine glutinosa TaxID=7769 RepID=UPI00358F8340
MWSEVDVVATEDTTISRLGGGCRNDWRARYQLDTLVRLSATSSVQQSPRLRSSSCSNGLILSVDTFVTVLEAGCLSVLLQLEFDSHVDVAALFHEGNFLLVGVGGNLHFGDVSSKEILLTKRLLPESTSNGDEAFVELVIEPDLAASGVLSLISLVAWHSISSEGFPSGNPELRIKISFRLFMLQPL